MSYGQNQPWGLMATKTTNGGTWNGQTSQYFIQSGYANNIFKGDLVYLGADGFIHNLSDLQVANYPTAQALGVFQGCSFTTPTSVNPIDPASPGRQYWPAGTNTLNGIPASCDIIDDLNVIFNVQSDITGLSWNAQGATASVAYTYFGGSLTNPSGNFNTGVSSLVLNGGSVGVNANLNLRILRFVPTVQTIPSPGGGVLQYVNAEVLIQNHSFVQRAVGL